jgi:FAD/FMN-containing dehydrogenase
MTVSAAASDRSPANAFAEILGTDRVITDEAERRYYSNDIFFWDDAMVAVVVVQPRTRDEVAEIVRVARDLGMAISTRGGGMSYTKGYVPVRADTVLIDLRGLDEIFEINTVDNTATVGAGCTWIKLANAVKEKGLSIAFSAPFSGLYSTVGGALSQNVPQGMDDVLALEVVRADGTVVQTGSGGRTNDNNPFFRNYGPDLTGLFLGDGGAFGVKTAATIRLTRKPEGAAYGSFAFETYPDMAATMVAIAGTGLVAGKGVVGLDPFKSQNVAKVGFKQAIKTLGEVAKAKGGLRETVKMAASGRNFMEGVKWSLHFTMSGVNDEAAEATLKHVRAACLERGREIPNILPMAMSVSGFSVRGFLGGDGQRWVPTNSMFPLSKAVAVAEAIPAYFDSHRAEMDRHGMYESYMTNFNERFFMCEPSFYWQDEVSELHLRHLDKESADKFRDKPANPEARAFAQELRAGLRDRMFELGAVHVQLAKFYRFEESLQPETWRLIRELKTLFDPEGILNPGNLGLD